jgi:predicted lipase
MIDANDIKIEIIDSRPLSINEIILKCLEYSNDAYGVDTSSNANSAARSSLIHKEFTNSIFNRVNLYYDKSEFGNLFIAIRGTVTMYDIMNDINFIQTKMEIEKAEQSEKEDLLVHSGFYQDFKDIKSFLRELITEEKEKSLKNIYFTGHSRGSGICTLSSIYIKTEFPELNVFNIGFGCPRIGCQKFTNYYNKLMRDTTYLFREDEDIVTRVPIYGYGDLMNQYVIKDNKVVSKYKPGEDDGIINMIESNFHYHRLENYKKCDYTNIPL